MTRVSPAFSTTSPSISTRLSIRPLDGCRCALALERFEGVQPVAIAHHGEACRLVAFSDGYVRILVGAEDAAMQDFFRKNPGQE